MGHGMPNRIVLSAALLILIGFMSGCSNDSSRGSGKAALKLKLSDSISSFGVSAASAVSAMAQGDRESFTPSSFKIPIMKIVLSGESGNPEQTLYACQSASEANCMVDLADATALASLSTQAQSATVQAGTYNRISIHTCADGKSGMDLTTIKVTGEGSVRGTRYITKNGNPSAAAHVSAPAEEVTMDNWACSTKSVSISPAVTVNDGDTVQLTVLVDHSMAGAFSDNHATGAPIGMCDDGTTANSDYRVCLAYPAALGYVGSGTPTMKRFKLTHSTVEADLLDTRANALIIVAVDDANKPLAAFWRPIVTPTSAVVSGNNSYYDSLFGGPNYVTESGQITVNSNGTISFGQGGIEDSKAAVFSAFEVQAHTGTVKTRDDDNWFYRAIPAN